MKSRPNFLPVACLVLLGVLYACGGGGGGGGGTSGSGGTTGRPPVANEPVCSGVSPASLEAHPNHIVSHSTTRVPGVIAGLKPAQIRGAYGVTGSGSGAIAIVGAYNFPTALNDFNVFSSTFSLPTEPSTDVTSSSNTVFQVVYASGSQPNDNGLWSQEAALDIEWAHALAPSAKIYLVEANSSNVYDLMAAANVAKNLPGVKQVSMSFSTNESACDFTSYNGNFLKNGVTFFAASGDSSTERAYPAMSYNVVSVGGTSLNVSALGQWLGESTWSSTGCGPSQFEPRPVYQDGLYPTIGKYRASADISAVADPNTGVAVYCSTTYGGDSGWMVFGGTSAATPIIAGAVNSAGNNSASSQALNTLFYSGIGTSSLHDITTGSSGSFNAVVGWDYPTGVGTPKDLAGLIAPAG